MRQYMGIQSGNLSGTAHLISNDHRYRFPTHELTLGLRAAIVPVPFAKHSAAQFNLLDAKSDFPSSKIVEHPIYAWHY